MPCGSVAPVMKKCITPHRQPRGPPTNVFLLVPLSAPFLLFFLCIGRLVFLPRPLVQHSIPLCFYCHPSPFESNHALFSLSSAQVLRYPRPTSSSPALFCPLRHQRCDSEAAAIAVCFGVSYYNIPNRDHSCQPRQITARRSHLHLVEPASALMEGNSGTITALLWFECF